MQLTLSQSHLHRLTRGFAKVIPSRGSTMPVLNQVRFRRIGANDAEVTATNQEETLTLALPELLTYLRDCRPCVLGNVPNDR